MDSGKIVFSVGNQLQTNYHSMSFPGSVWDRHACPSNDGINAMLV